MWRDEVRAFSVAIHAQPLGDLFNSIHQDGHPVLWYAILRAGYALTHSNLVLPIASLLIAWAAAFLILRFAPFPLWTRLLMVFGVFLGHEFSVIARNYGIGVLLLIVACIVFRSRRERPLRLGIVLALLANTSVHATIAALLLGFVWAVGDFANSATRRSLSRPTSLAALGIVLVGAAFALWSAHVPSDMIYAVPLTQLLPNTWGVVPFDPGIGLMGTQLANIAAAGEIPWIRAGIDPVLASRIIVDAALLGIVWVLRRRPVSLVAAVLAIVAFEVIFRVLYSGSLRHEGILAFFLISLVWIAFEDSTDRAEARQRTALGLLPLLLFQAAALPIVARRTLTHPTSSSKAFAALIDRTPAWRNAILAGEPDFIMEPMPYYVSNSVFMPRQRAFDYRAYFDRGIRRKLDLRLGSLIDMTDSLSCATRRPVLLAIAYPKLLSDSSGEMRPSYPGTVFRWDSSDRSRLFAEGKRVASFTQATTDENYSVFEFKPRMGATCGSESTRRD
jgi:hypothetical protein